MSRKMMFAKMFCWLPVIAFAAVAGCGSKLPVEYPPDMKVALILRNDIDAGGASAAAVGPSLVEPSGWATLTGKFTLTGTPPEPRQLQVDKDTATCAPGGKAVYANDVIVDAAGGWANVLVFLNTAIPSDDPKWISAEYDAEKEATLTANPFDQKNCLFLSHIYPVRSTQTVVVKNSDNIGHNAKIDPPSGVKADNLLIPGGQSVTYRAGGESKAPFPVTCSIHPWMKAYMISRNNPYFAVTKPDGTFEIKNVPAGPGLKLEFCAWQEKANFLQKVTVDGQAASWNKGKFSLELTPGETKNLNVVIDASVLPK